MAIAPLNKFLTKAVPVTPSNQQVYEAHKEQVRLYFTPQWQMSALDNLIH